MGEDSLFLIVGLGNPGERYAQTRHNAGFEVVKALLKRHSFADKKVNKLAQSNRGVIRGHQVLLVQPRTFMNLSGDAVQHFMSFYKVAPERLLVISDDFALPLGRLRLRASGSAGGQNGLKHIIERLGSERFPRLRFGIGPVPENWDAADFVLGKVSRSEQKAWEETVERAAEAVECWLERGLDETASRYNGGPREAQECAD